MAKKAASGGSKGKVKAKAKTKAKVKAPPRPAKRASKRVSWLDAKSQTPLIDDYARQMESYAKAIADGVVEDKEIKEQEARLVALMKEIEPQLSDALHEKVTRLLCEVTVYDLLQTLYTLHQARPRTQFRG